MQTFQTIFLGLPLENRVSLFAWIKAKVKEPLMISEEKTVGLWTGTVKVTVKVKE